MKFLVLHTDRFRRLLDKRWGTYSAAGIAIGVSSTTVKSWCDGQQPTQQHMACIANACKGDDASVFVAVKTGGK